MKATDLMIGDWVHLYVNNDGITDENVKVISLGEDWISIVNKFDLDEEYAEDDCVDGVSAITPIPLTEEILKANGFEGKSEKARYGSVFYGLSVGNLSITFEVDNGLPILTIEDTADRSSQHNVICLKDEIYNVHELQHALRLCGLNDIADNFQV